MLGNQLVQETVFYDKYARWDEAKGRRETWVETVERVIGFFKANTPFNTIPEQDQAAIEQAMLAQQVLPAMRIMQMAGTPLERCNVGAYNCCYTPVEDIKDFADILYILMQGTGVGFSVEKRYVERLPRIEPLADTLYGMVKIPDTTEGWCDSVERLLVSQFKGSDVVFDYSQIRPKGERLKTKGGTASGPEPLKVLHTFIRRIFAQRREEGFLRSIDVYDIVCQTGAIVEVGGVRRAALMCLCDLDDVEMRDAKKGEFWLTQPQRNRSNNSAVYETDEVPEIFTSEFNALKESGTGERGIFNRRYAQLKYGENQAYGTNPCGEIILRPRQFCNLSIAVVRPEDTQQTLNAKVRLATILGTLQATLTKFTYIKPQYKENCEDERLLGVDITGQLDNKLFVDIFHDGMYTGELFVDLADVAVVTNALYAKLIGIRTARAVTTVKPSGNSSQLLDCASGLHPRFAPYYVRRLRIGSDSPVAKILEELGVPGESALGEHTVKVFEFPVKSPDGALTRHDSSAIKQLKYWRQNELYTEHSPSCTIYVKEHEWEHVEQFVVDHFKSISGVSFLPYDGGVYKQAPYEEITENEFKKRNQALPENVNWPEMLKKYEDHDTTTSARELACIGGVCEI